MCQYKNSTWWRCHESSGPRKHSGKWLRGRECSKTPRHKAGVHGSLHKCELLFLQTVALPWRKQVPTLYQAHFQSWASITLFNPHNSSGGGVHPSPGCPSPMFSKSPLVSTHCTPTATEFPPYLTGQSSSLSESETFPSPLSLCGSRQLPRASRGSLSTSVKGH